MKNKDIMYTLLLGLLWGIEFSELRQAGDRNISCESFVIF